ncbi:AAA family ATPase [Nocardia abscessus]|uniref:AAA family ATPase n=1 Tax=Nocardia abscessus TaxID=120957 RepID=UPI002453A197|nr:AAA family ATPase [Nocardia abscessus]
MAGTVALRADRTPTVDGSHRRRYPQEVELIRLVFNGHHSVEMLDFEAAPLTVLFGMNNAGKTNILEVITEALDDEKAVTAASFKHQ